MVLHFRTRRRRVMIGQCRERRRQADSMHQSPPLVFHLNILVREDIGGCCRVQHASIVSEQNVSCSPVVHKDALRQSCPAQNPANQSLRLLPAPYVLMLLVFLAIVPW